MIGASMDEPEPTPADQWSQWETDPKIPSYWPGLGNEHRGDGFEIDRRGVKVVSGKLVNLAVDISKYDYLYAVDYILPGTHWALPRDLSFLFSDADQAVHDFWKDLHAEVGMAGLLIERAATNYQLADDPRLGDLPISRLDERLVEMMPGDAPSSVLTAPSALYPSGSVTLQLPKAVDYGVGQMTAEKAAQDIAYFYHGGNGDQGFYEQMADSLVELANTLQLRAQDLRDSPWRGEAADNGQAALRQIYGNATALAALVGNLSAARSRFWEITDWCYKNFEQMADPDRSGWNEFWDLGGTADSRTRSFLAQANNEFLDVYRMMPKQIKEDLPGLLVTDASLAEFRKMVHDVETRPKDSTFLKKNDSAWLHDNRPILQGYEQAEKNYG
jgi:hypothetical protein